MLFIPINGNEDGKSGWCEFFYFRSNHWRQFIVLLEISCKDTNIHKNVENKIPIFGSIRLKMSKPVTNYLCSCIIKFIKLVGGNQ